MKALLIPMPSFNACKKKVNILKTVGLTPESRCTTFLKILQKLIFFRCASKPGQFIDVSETFGSRRQNGSRQERDPTARGSSPSVFSKFSDLEIGDESYGEKFFN